MKLTLVSLLLFTACHATPEELLRTLYDVHRPYADDDIEYDDREELARFFTPELTELFMRDAECVDRTGEQCNLGFDPIFNAQDYSDELNPDLDLVIEKVGERRYKVTFTNLTRRSLVYEVEQTRNGWRISDIVYPEGGNLKAILSFEL